MSHCCANSDVVVSDLWDMPHDLHSICDGERTLLFVCDPKITTCREGAVHFDSQSRRIKARKIRPACIFTGSPREVRDAVLALDLSVPVYVGTDREVFGNLVDQKVLPAMVLLDRGGTVIKTLYGGGESLDYNLRILLEEESRGGGLRLLLILVPLAVIGAVLFLID